MSTVRTTVSLLTPSGRGAIATLSVRGTQAVSAVEQCFQSITGKPLRALPPRRTTFGNWQSTAEASEELVVCRVAENQVEIHCHGGRSATAAIIASLAKQGVEEITAESFVQDETHNTIIAEAWLALSQARTERTALHLLAQYQGALRRSIETILQAIYHNDLNLATKLIDDLLERKSFGLHLTQPWRVVLVGEPNVGKSSLMNALVGYARSIVFAEPGTTRDIVSALTAFAGWPVELLDTAGLRETHDAIEWAGVQLTNEQIATADLVLLVVEASRAWSPEYDAILARVPNAIVVMNKVDLVSKPMQHPPMEACCVSAVTGAGIEQLGDRIAERLVPHPPAEVDPIPFTSRQINQLSEARLANEKDDLSQACKLLSQLIST